MLIYLTYDITIIKNDDSLLCYGVITQQKIDRFSDFSGDIDYNSKTYVFRDVDNLIINQCKARLPKDFLADTKCPPAAQRKQANALL